MKILVCGDRNWTDHKAINRELKKYSPDTTVIQGGARGADRIAGQVASALGMKVITVSAEWNKYGKAAGIYRNIEMLNMKPDEVLAFHEFLPNSKGTKHTVEEANKRGIPTRVFVN